MAVGVELKRQQERMTRRAFIQITRPGMSGLTLLELLVVLAIIGVLARWASASYAEHVERTRVFEAATTIAALSANIEGYIQYKGRAPHTLEEIGIGEIIDPWGNAYIYNPNMNQNGFGSVRKDRNLNPLNTDFDLYSAGRDGSTQKPLAPPPSHDDVIRAMDGGYLGLAEDF